MLGGSRPFRANVCRSECGKAVPLLSGAGVGARWRRSGFGIGIVPAQMAIVGST